jgi:Cu(I)/Ag(I) efflux system membrane fusion protein
MKKILMIVALIATTQITFAQNKAKVALNDVLSAYYDVKNALATDKNEEAAEKIKVFQAKVDAVPHETLPSTQHTLWMEQSKIMKSKAKEIAASKDIKLQRKSFEGISYAMIKTLKATKFNQGTVYVQHCPMAKASWLNEKENVENPYYGSMMFDCGEVSETIKGK